MKIIKNYISREFLKMFFTILISFIGIYFIVEFFERIDDFVEHHANFYDSISYFVFKMPLIISQITPFAVLLATVLTFCIFSKNNEIIAMRSSGISLMEISSPLILLSILISILSFIGNEHIIPYTNQKYNFIFDVKIRKKQPKGIFRTDKIWYHGEDNTIWNIQLFDGTKDMMRGVTLHKFNEENVLIERIDASLVKWEDGKWNFLNGNIVRFTQDGGFSSESYESKNMFFPEEPKDFKNIKKDPEEMSFNEIYSYVKELKKKGFDDTKYSVDMYGKLAAPLSSFIMVLFGIPFSLKSGRTGGIFKGIVATIIIGFSYWIISSIGITLGHSGTLPPLIAAWTPNILFIAIGLYLLISVWH